MIQGYYHIYSYGEDTPRLIRNERSFIVAVNLLAYCSTIFEIELIAYAIMNSHFHAVVRCTGEVAEAFSEKLMKLLVRRSNQNGSEQYSVQNTSVSAKIIEDEQQLKRTICYVIRNPIDAGFKMHPDLYRWSSANLYFRGHSPRGKRLSDYTVRERRSLCGIRYDLPMDWTIEPDGLIDNSHFVKYALAESLFGGIRAYLAFLYIKKDDVFEMNRSCSKLADSGISDIELYTMAEEFSFKTFRKSVTQLGLKDKLTVAQRMRSSYGAGNKQLSRLTGIPVNQLDTILT